MENIVFGFNLIDFIRKDQSCFFYDENLQDEIGISGKIRMNKLLTHFYNASATAANFKDSKYANGMIYYTDFAFEARCPSFETCRCEQLEIEEIGPMEIEIDQGFNFGGGVKEGLKEQGYQVKDTLKKMIRGTLRKFVVNNVGIFQDIIDKALKENEDVFFEFLV